MPFHNSWARGVPTSTSLGPLAQWEPFQIDSSSHPCRRATTTLGSKCASIMAMLCLPASIAVLQRLLPLMLVHPGKPTDIVIPSPSVGFLWLCSQGQAAQLRTVSMLGLWMVPLHHKVHCGSVSSWCTVKPWYARPQSQYQCKLESW